jgi:hypothetical protein
MGDRSSAGHAPKRARSLTRLSVPLKGRSKTLPYSNTPKDSVPPVVGDCFRPFIRVHQWFNGLVPTARIRGSVEALRGAD